MKFATTCWPVLLALNGERAALERIAAEQAANIELLRV